MSPHSGTVRSRTLRGTYAPPSPPPPPPPPPPPWMWVTVKAIACVRCVLGQYRAARSTLLSVSTGLRVAWYCRSVPGTDSTEKRVARYVPARARAVPEMA
eukprot:1279257-Rhodomonas_salina.2